MQCFLKNKTIKFIHTTDGENIKTLDLSLSHFYMMFSKTKKNYLSSSSNSTSLSHHIRVLSNVNRSVTWDMLIKFYYKLTLDCFQHWDFWGWLMPIIDISITLTLITKCVKFKHDLEYFKFKSKNRWVIKIVSQHMVKLSRPLISYCFRKWHF